VTTDDEDDDPKDVEDLLASLKNDVQQLEYPEDGQAHFDLASAYREMGLVDDALEEFRLAAQAPALACKAGLEIGQIHLERGETELAVAAWMKALAAKERDAVMTRQLCELLARHGHSMA
jgi:pilus assembly protein FimV